MNLLLLKHELDLGVMNGGLRSIVAEYLNRAVVVGGQGRFKLMATQLVPSLPPHSVPLAEYRRNINNVRSFVSFAFRK